MEQEAASKVKMVSIKAKLGIRLADGTSIAPGVTAQVSEAEAKEFCDTKFTGQYDFSGAGHGKLPVIVRAERVS